MKCHLLAALVVALAQSLGDVGRREAERRNNVEPGGETERVLTNDDVAKLRGAGNVSVFSPAMKKLPPPPDTSHERGSPMRYRSALMKLDREIRSAEDRLDSLRKRAAAEKWAIPKGRTSRRGGRSTSDNRRPDVEIDQWARKLERLKRERFETYDAGRRAGFIPGELEGKGIVP